MDLPACKPSLESSDPKLRVRALALETSQTNIAKVAAKDPSWFVREAALQHVNDQNLLKWIAMNQSSLPDAFIEEDSSATNARESATTQRQWVTTKVTVDSNIKVDAIRKAAVDRIDDQGVLAAIATQATFSNYFTCGWLGNQAVLRISDHALLIEIVERSGTWYAEQVLRRATDEGALKRLQAAGGTPKFRQAAKAIRKARASPSQPHSRLK